MADILAALEQLEGQNKKPTNNKFVDPLRTSRRSVASVASRRSNSSQHRVGRTETRPSSVYASREQSRARTPNPNLLSPTKSQYSPERSPSVVSGRRISFAHTPQPPPSGERRLRLTTKGSSLGSGFEFDAKLRKYGIDERIWNGFSTEVISAAQLPRFSNVAWSLRKGRVIRKIKRDLQYEGDVKRCLNAWNKKAFKPKGFQVSLELPGPPKIRETNTPEENEMARKEAKLFRVVITPNAERAGSIYSRSSSLTRSVTGEATSVQAAARASLESERGSDKGKSDDEEEIVHKANGSAGGVEHNELTTTA